MGRHRLALLTLDFEGFSSAMAGPWIAAMNHWAQAAGTAGLPFAFFISLEHVSVLRTRERAVYLELVDALRRLSDCGCEPHVHNHCLFDWERGVRSVDTDPFANRVSGYPHRASMWYDVVRRNGRCWAEWALELRSAYDELLADMDVRPPEHLAFRAGGWDTGATRAEWDSFVHGLTAAGFAVDSSDLGRLSGRPGRFARSAYRLPSGLVELSPCVWMDCGSRGVRRLPAPPAAVLRQSSVALPGGGVLVVVLHFDHLFHTRQSPWSLIGDPGLVAARIETFMETCRGLLRLLRLEARELGEVVRLAG